MGDKEFEKLLKKANDLFRRFGRLLQSVEPHLTQEQKARMAKMLDAAEKEFT